MGSDASGILGVLAWLWQGRAHQELSERLGTFSQLISRLDPYRPRLAIFPMSSVEAADWVADASLDLVFIDADHTYKSVSADIRAWLPKVRPGGILAGHDYSSFFPGVVQAVRELAQDTGWQLHLSTESLWWLHVPHTEKSVAIGWALAQQRTAEDWA